MNIAAALLCVISVVALCIAPSVDIPDTTLQALQAGFLMMLILIAGAFLRAGIVDLTPLPSSFGVGRLAALIRSPLLPIQANCVQQC